MRHASPRPQRYCCMTRPPQPPPPTVSRVRDRAVNCVIDALNSKCAGLLPYSNTGRGMASGRSGGYAFQNAVLILGRTTMTRAQIIIAALIAVAVATTTASAVAANEPPLSLARDGF